MSRKVLTSSEGLIINTVDAGNSGTAISSCEVVTARFPLAQSLRVGNNLVHEREYTFVSIRTGDGVTGEAYALTRRLPVLRELAEFLAPNFLGTCVDDPRAAKIHRASKIRPLDIDSGIRRADALLDVATWDLLGKVQGQPAYKLLGKNSSRSAPAKAISVVGYMREDDSEDDLVHRVADMDFGLNDVVKIAGHADHEALARLAVAFVDRSSGPSSAIVDMAWSLYSESDMARFVKAMQGVSLTWLEDPVHAEDSADLGRARGAWPGVLAVGDEVSSLSAVTQAVQDGLADVLRIDSMTAGGLTRAYDHCNLSSLQGVDISPHIYPEVHAHLAAACPNVAYLEFFPEDGSLDANDKFVADREFNPGSPTAVPTRDGIGLELDWSAIRDHAVELVRLEAHRD